MLRTIGSGLVVALGVAAAVPLAGQAPGVVRLNVKETAGIRRTEYPVSARLTLPKGALSDISRVRLMAADAEVVGQYAAVTAWDDGSVREVEADFNLSIGASESRTLRLEYGAAVVVDAKPRGALTVLEQPDGIQVGSVRFGSRGWPLLASVVYRGEIIGPGDNGITLVDATGVRKDFGTARAVAVDVVKRGPLLVVIRYSGRIPIDDTVEVPVTLTCEMPNSKTWIKMRVSIEDPGRRIRGVIIETPLTLGAFPWTWDFGTDSGTYGAFRAPADSVVLTQTVTPADHAWRVETGTASGASVYEQSMPGRAGTVGGWGHLLDARNVIAFAMDRFASGAGTYRFALNGEGQTSFSYTRSQPVTRHELVLYQHYVGTPMPIGAATSPTAMLKPLLVAQER